MRYEKDLPRKFKNGFREQDGGRSTGAGYRLLHATLAPTTRELAAADAAADAAAALTFPPPGLALGTAARAF
eukprot:4438716-Prymnesium_polylepis.1